MKISTRATLSCSIDSAWEALHNPAIFRAVSAPFTVFADQPGNPLPRRFRPDTDYTVSVRAGGVVPLGNQTIHLVDDVADWTSRVVTDTGHGTSGALGLLRDWHHRMSLVARPDGGTDFSDTLSVRAGLLTPLLWLALRVMWSWRGFRLRLVTRTLDPSATAAWNARYARKGAMWSGKVNPVLEDVFSAHSPGVAIDAGAGEGGDALWLAQRGWSVTALEASSVGIYRGVHEAAQHSTDSGDPLDIHWRVWDLEEPWPVASGGAGAVSLQFIHTDAQARKKIWEHAIDAVSPGGTLLIVGHDPQDGLAGIPRPPADMCFTEEQLREAVPGDWSRVSTRVVARTQNIGGEDVAVHDIVLEATR